MPRWRERRRHRVPRAVCAYGCSDEQEILWSRFDNHAESLCQDGESAAATGCLGRFARMAAATSRRSFGPVSTIMQNLYAKMARAPPPQGASGGLRVWLQRRAGDPLVPFRQSCRISMPRWRERRRHRVPRAVCAYGCSDEQEILWSRFDNHAESLAILA